MWDEWIIQSRVPRKLIEDSTICIFFLYKKTTLSQRKGVSLDIHLPGSYMQFKSVWVLEQGKFIFQWIYCKHETFYP